jgi:glycosyltransferase involved in cell wall biosynthesis
MPHRPMVIADGADSLTVSVRPSLPITAVVLTFNEELNLESCLQSLAGWAERVIIVDSGSTDRTLEIARCFGAVIIGHPFESHSKQWTWALQQLPPSADWVLALDADQTVTSELQYELTFIFGERYQALSSVEGIYIKRRQVFRGKWIRHGGYYPKYLLKLFRKRACVFDDLDLVDHHFYVKGATVNLENDIIEHNRKEDDITFWTEKHTRYASRLALESQRRRRELARAPVTPAWFGSPDQRVLRMKVLWARLPLYLRPALYFVYRYIFRLGFLDGKQGFIFHFLQGFWFRLLVDIKLDEGYLND